MIGRTISHYRITRRIGAGGMGVVYEAIDEKLDRPVALKFLPPESTRDPDARARFIHEAKAASALDHPNICNVHEIGETDDGQLFIAMACYEGATLKERIADGPLPLDEAQDITRQVAEGLAKAHEREILHRDVKPANLFITGDGLVKILDFGLAKLSDGTKVTKTGTTMGTAGYMSPEQARGEETDRRSDLWCLGVVLYEMITGKLPFPGDHQQTIIHAILNNEPEPVTGLRTGVPMELERIVGKCLAKDPAERYQHATDLLADLKRLERESTTGSSETVLLGDVTPRQRRWPWMLGFLGLGAVLVLAAWAFWPAGAPSISPDDMSLAIMEFRDLGAADDSMASITATELLHTAMVESCPIRIQSPEYLRDVCQRKFGATDATEAEGQELELARTSGATFVLTGRMGHVDDERFVTWRLVDVGDGQSVGAGRVASASMFDMIDEVVGEVLQLVSGSMGAGTPVEQVPVANITSESSVAYEHYITGKHLMERSKAAEAARAFERAVEEDPTFASAYFELARYHFNLSGAHVDISRARAYADLALQYEQRMGIRERLSLQAFMHGLDYRANKEIALLREIADRWPDDREALKILAQKSYWWWQFQGSIETGLRGYELYPDDSSFVGAHYLASLIELGRGRKLYLSSAQYLNHNPDEPVAWEFMGDAYLALARPDSARLAYDKACQLDPTWGRDGLAFTASAEGDLDLAISIVQDELGRDDISDEVRFGLTFSPYYPYICLGGAYFRAGRHREAVAAMETAHDLVGDDPSLWQWQAGRILSKIGRADEALRMALEMERSDEMRSRVFALRFKGHAQMALGDLDGARATVLRIRELVDDLGPFIAYYAHKIEAEVALHEGRPEAALHALGEMSAIALGFYGLGHFEDRMMMAEAHHMAGDGGEAIRILEDLVHIHRGYALAHYRLGVFYGEDGRDVDATESLSEFLRLWHKADPDLPQLDDARRRLAALRVAH